MERWNYCTTNDGREIAIGTLCHGGEPCQHHVRGLITGWGDEIWLALRGITGLQQRWPKLWEHFSPYEDCALRKLIYSAKLAFQQQCVFTLAELQSPEALTRAETALNATGVLFITEAIPAEELPKITESVLATVNSHLGKFYPQFAAVQRLSELTDALHQPNTATGIIAAKQTGMLFMFPPTKQQQQARTDFGTSIEVVDHNSWYSDVNLALLHRQPALAALLCCLQSGGNGRRSISIDAGKLSDERFPPTELHIDLYTAARTQACLHVLETGSRSLGYLPTIPELNTWLRESGLFDKGSGFKKLAGCLSDAALDIIKNSLIAPPARSLVLWRSGVIHGEYESRAESTVNPLRRAIVPSDEKSGQVLRLYLGTHEASLPPSVLLKQTYLALHDICPSRFRSHSTNCAFCREKMSKGSTGPFPKCKRSVEELQRVAEIVEHFESVPGVAQLAALAPLQQQFGGLPQALDSLPPEFARLLTPEQQAAWNNAAARLWDSE